MIEEIYREISGELIRYLGSDWDEIVGEVVAFLVIGSLVYRSYKKGKKGKTQAPQSQNTPYAPGRVNTGAGNRVNTYAPQKQTYNSAPMQARTAQSSAMPHTHRPSGVYDTYNKKSVFNDSGTMPHKHESGHYTSMMDVSKLPKGYILLNGEPVRVADLEGK